MPRSSKVEPCMLCGKMPCECRAKKSPLKRERRIRHLEDVPLPETKSDMRQAMKAAAQFTPQPVVIESPPSNWEKILTHEHEVEDETDVAIKVLLDANMLHPDERKKYAHLTSVEARAKAWKERNNGSTDDTSA